MDLLLLFATPTSKIPLEDIFLRDLVCSRLYELADIQRRCNCCWLKDLDVCLAEAPQEDHSSANYNHGQWTELSSQMQDAVRESAKDLYQPLKPWQTRMVTILVAQFDSLLQCQLQTVEITENEGLECQNNGWQNPRWFLMRLCLIPEDILT